MITMPGISSHVVAKLPLFPNFLTSASGRHSRLIFLRCSDVSVVVFNQALLTRGNMQIVGPSDDLRIGQHTRGNTSTAALCACVLQEKVILGRPSMEPEDAEAGPMYSDVRVVSSCELPRRCGCWHRLSDMIPL